MKLDLKTANYPKLVRCPITGVMARVNNQKEERAFFWVPISAVPCSVALVLVLHLFVLP